MAQTEKIGTHATAIYENNGYIVVRYHATQVVKFNDHEIVLNSDGWQTHTTKNRMNQASNQFNLGFIVRQKDYNWHVYWDGQWRPFFDGIVLKRK